MSRAVFLDGPVGVGKTTLGRALAGRLQGAFVDGDDHAVPGRPWFASSLGTSRRILAAVLAAERLAVVAYPLRLCNHVFYARHLRARGVQTLFVGLHAPAGAILALTRGRRFSPAEHDRVHSMIQEGYGRRAFHDLSLDTTGPFVDTLDRLDRAVRAWGAG